MTAFMILCFYSCILLMLIINLNEIKPKKNIILGATIPYTHLGSSDVKAITGKYKKESLIIHAVLIAAVIPCFFVPDSAMLFYLMTWLTVAIVVQALPYIKANKALRSFKKSISDSAGTKEKVVDLKLSSIDIKAASPYHSLVPAIISLIPCAYLLFKPAGKATADMLFAYILISACILLCMVLHIITNRRSRDAVSENTDINKALSTIRKRNWAKMFIGLNYALAFMNLVIFADITLGILSPVAAFISLSAFTVFVIVYSLSIDLDTRKKQQEYTGKNSEASQIVADEDDYWIFGMFYYNPNDKRVMIPDRVGTNTTVNMATKVGKSLMILSAVIILAMPFIGAWFWYADEYPMTVEFTDTAIVATHLSEEYNIPLDEVVSKKELKKCPKLTTKINGWNTSKVAKGTFRSAEYGICEVFISTDAETFYVIETDDTTYILGK